MLNLAKHEQIFYYKGHEKCSMNEDDLLFDIPECFTGCPIVSLKLSPWLFVHGPVIDYLARWTKQDESCSFLSNLRDLLRTGYSSTAYIFQSTIQQLPLLFSNKNDRFQLSPFPPPQKKNDPPFPICAAWCPLTPFPYPRCQQAWIWWSLAKQDNGSPQKC